MWERQEAQKVLWRLAVFPGVCDHVLYVRTCDNLLFGDHVSGRHVDALAAPVSDLGSRGIGGSFKWYHLRLGVLRGEMPVKPVAVDNELVSVLDVMQTQCGGCLLFFSTTECLQYLQ